MKEKDRKNLEELFDNFFKTRSENLNKMCYLGPTTYFNFGYGEVSKNREEIFERFFKDKDAKWIKLFKVELQPFCNFVNGVNIGVNIPCNESISELETFKECYSSERFEDLFNKIYVPMSSRWLNNYYLPMHKGRHLLHSVVSSDESICKCKLVPTNDGTDDKWCPICGCRYRCGNIFEPEHMDPYFSKSYMRNHYDHPPVVFGGHHIDDEFLRKELRALLKSVHARHFTSYKNKSMLFLQFHGNIPRSNYDGHILYYLWSVSCKYGYSERVNCVKFLFDKDTPEYITTFIKEFMEVYDK